MYTINQDPNERTVSLNLSNYLKKPEAATKTELNDLKAIVDTKLSSVPSHQHGMNEIEHLAESLSTKLDNKLYSYRTILSDSQLIDFLEHPKVVILDITKDKLSSGYKFKVDDSNNLLIQDINGNTIMWYNAPLQHWIVGTEDLTDFISTTNNTLLNHAEAIRQLASVMGVEVE